MLGYIEVQNLPAIMGDHEEAVEDTESDCGHCEEIHCCNRFPMIVKECFPASCQFWISRRSLHPTGDGAFRNIEAKLQQFAMNMGSAPGVVLGDHLEDEISYLFTNPPSSQGMAMPGEPTPVQTKSGPMPARHGFGCDIQQSLFPSGP
jgi:hypothetical protein